MTNAWAGLRPGERFRVADQKGAFQEAIFLAAGLEAAGLYVRLSSGELARLAPRKLDWKTLERFLVEDLLARDDWVTFRTNEPAAHRGRLLAPPEWALRIEPEGAEAVTVPLEQVKADSLRLLFAAPHLLVGDEFIVRETAGREWRGRVTRFDTALGAVIATLPDGNTATLKVKELELPTLRVLIPITLG